MVDFRYHLISLIAVILALALGILAGSGFLGGPILEQLEGQVKSFRSRIQDQQATITEQDTRLAQADRFAVAIEPLMLRGRLAGEEIVLFQFEGSDGRLVDGIRTALTEAGAQVISQVTLSEKFALDSAPARDELSLVTGSLSTDDPQLLLEEAASLIGGRAAIAAADQGEAQTPNTTAEQRFLSVLQELEASEFISTDLPESEEAVPLDASFVVIGGSGDRPPFDLSRFAPALGEALSEAGAATLFVETSASGWGLVGSVRTDIEAQASVATVDNGESPMGRIAAVMGLDEAGAGNVGHFGVRSQSTGVIPETDPSG